MSKSIEQALEQTGWLIERNDYYGTQWLRFMGHHGEIPTLEWTTESSIALRFARREDAEWIIRKFPMECVLCVPTEHVWVDLPPQGEKQ